MKTYIKDINTNEFYCVPMTETDHHTGELIAGNNDFPYWSEDINEAHNFSGGLFDGKLMAENEMKFNDFSERKVEIINIA